MYVCHTYLFLVWTLKLIICKILLYSSVAEDHISGNGLEPHLRGLFAKMTNGFVCCLWVKIEDGFKNYVVHIINQKYMFGIKLIRVGSLFWALRHWA